MLFNTVIKIDISTCMTHSVDTSALRLLLLLLSFMMNNTLSIISNANAHNSIISPSTTIIIEGSMVNAFIPSILINHGINHCTTVVTTITITVAFIITTITMIATSKYN